MLKKLVALTLAALMLINPMTAMAVTWDSLLQGLAVAREQGGNKYEEEGVMLEVEGTSAKIYGDGLLENFYNVEEFTSYTFSGNITVGGETFEVYVYDVPVRDENGTPIYNEDGSMQRQAQQAVVNIESGVAITATEVRFGVDDNSTLKVTTKGSIGFDADGTLVTERVSFDVSEDATANAEMTVVNEGDIATIENIWMGADGEGTLDVTNDGTMTTENEIGMHVYGSAEGTLINSGTLTANASGLGEEGAQVGIGVHGEGTATVINIESGVINSELSGWLDSDATNGTLNMTNDGTVNGNVGAWGFEGGYEDEEGNWVESTTGGVISLENTGDITGSLGTFTNDNISSNVTNSGTAESMFADNNGAGDITSANDGEVTDFSAGANGDGDVTATNSGTVHNEMWVGSVGSGTIEATNSGTVEGMMHLYQEGDGEATLTNEGTTNELSNYITETATGTASVINENEAQYIWTNNEGSGELTVTNTGTAVEMTTYATGNAKVDMTNDGEVEWLYSGVEGNATVVTTNTGTATDFHSDVHGEGYLTQINEGTVTNQFSGVANDGAILNNVNNGTAANVGTDANGESIATMNNTGSITEAAWNNATGEAQVSASNSGDINYFDASVMDSAKVSLSNAGTAESVYVSTAGTGSATVTNDGTVNYKLGGEAFGSSELNVTSNGIVGDGEQNYDEEGNAIAPDGIWVGTFDTSTGSAVNNGTINGELGVGARDEASAAATNNGTAQTGWVDSYDNGNVTMDIGGVSGQTTVAGNNKVSVIITAPSGDVTDTATVAALIEQSVVGAEGGEVEIGDIYTRTSDGELIARYSVAADGTIVLEEVLMEQGGGDGDDPRFWTKERIRHDMEEKRKAAEIGGVYGSPYWLKQLYLGYMSLNLRLFDGEEQLLFKESISWVPGANVAGEKILTLNVKIEDTSSLAMRLDGAVIDKLEQADIVTINIVDGAGNLFMEYQVEDLKGAREMYGLTAKESIVVGSADADVMKIAEDGTISPIEGETEDEPAA